MNRLRAIEAFVIVLASEFLTALVVAGDPVDLGTPSGQAAVATGALAALGIAVRRYAVTRG